MSHPIDPISYVRLPRLDVASALSLGKMLIMLMPKFANKPMRDAALEMYERVVKLHDNWTQQAVPLARADARPIDRRLDALYGAVRDRLIAFAALPEGEPDRSRALQLHDTVFGEGLGFLRLPFVAQHAESERRLSLIDKNGFGKDMDRLVGEPFMKALRSTHREYGDALGITKAAAPAAEPVTVVDDLRALVEAMTAYTIQLLAVAKAVKADPRRVGAVRRALEPIDKFRAASSSRRGDAPDIPGDAPTATAPVPPLPAVDDNEAFAPT